VIVPALGILLFGLTANELSAQPTPAGTRIVNSAQVSYQSQNGLTFTVVSDADAMTVGQVAGVDVDPPEVVVADPGTTVSVAHSLTNLGNATDSFTVVGRSVAPWPVRVHVDVNANAVLDPGDTPVAGALALAMGETVRLLLSTDIPPVPALRGTTDTLRIVATSQFDAAVADSVSDLLQIRDVGIVVALTTVVDRADATIGDVLTYTIRYTATGSGSASNFRLVDLIPLGTTYLPGTMRLDGVPLSDGPGDDAGTFSAAAAQVRLVLATVTGGQTGAFVFPVRVVSP
jgi:trimeric autotransporter adhesin